jgi:hypothetical protein
MRNLLFLTVLQGQAPNILQTEPTEATYDGIVGAPRDTFGDHQLAAAYWVRMSDVTLYEFAAALEQLANRALIVLPVSFIQKEGAYIFIDGIRDWQVKQNLSMKGTVP